jgi:membrane protein implicated in regulation of membrane protease activity
MKGIMKRKLAALASNVLMYVALFVVLMVFSNWWLALIYASVLSILDLLIRRALNKVEKK